jgi:intracellular multiplication protein IcmK
LPIVSTAPEPVVTPSSFNAPTPATSSPTPIGIVNSPPGSQPLPTGLAAAANAAPNNNPSSAANVVTGPPTQIIDPAVIGTTKDPAFQNVSGKIFPMSPEQIQALHGLQDTTQRAIAGSATTPPRPVVSTQNVLLSPGAVPPIVRLGTGYVTSIVFIDQTGSPWPVAAFSIGDPTRFNIQWDQESNVMMMQGRGAYATGNMAVRLRDLPTPVMLTLVSDQRVVDYRLDLRVQGRGPKATGSMIAGTLPSTNSNPVLMNLLDGVAPTDATRLDIQGGQAEAWLYGNHLLLRTALTVLSPSWQATMSSPDGTKVYQLTPTPLVLVSDQGRTASLQIKGL